jgi:uncharacterized protein YjbI with pentapeptide repeats
MSKMQKAILSRLFCPEFSRFVASLCLLCFVYSATAGGVYKWVDSSGTVHYDDKPPQGKAVTTIDTGSTSHQQQGVQGGSAAEAKPFVPALPSSPGSRVGMDESEIAARIEAAKARMKDAETRVNTARERAQKTPATTSRYINGCLVQQNAKCTNPDFKNADLSGANLYNAALINADFSGANLTKVDFRNAQLVNANFTGAYFRQTNLHSANLSRADLRGIRIEETSFMFVNLQGANLSGLDLSGVDMRFADLRWVIQKGTALDRADLRSAKQTINGCELIKNAKCPGAKLNGANLNEADLNGADLSGADLTAANLKQAQLEKSNLSGADLTGADLSGANFDGANLSRATFDKATMLGISLRGADMSAAKLRALPQVHRLGFANVNLENADFSNSNLWGVGFWSCNLKNTSFEGADLSQANLTGSDTSKARFGTAKISSCKGCVIDEKNMEMLKRTGETLRKILRLSQGTNADLPEDVQAVVLLFDNENKLGVRISGNPLYFAEAKESWGPGDRNASMLALSGDSNANYIFYRKPRSDQKIKCDRLMVGITSSIFCPENPVCLAARVPGSVKRCAVHTDYNLMSLGYETAIYCENGYFANYVANGISHKTPPSLAGSSVNVAECFPQAAPAMPASPPMLR